MPTLDWIGKKAVINHDKQVPFHLLNEVPELSYGDKDSGNMLIQGDNLVALKSLLPYYAGKVKCIYIDPPYNTGNEGWIYNDNVNSPEIKEWLGNVVGKEAEDLSRHDKWLCMMYPRLKLLREFLREDGSIWISIDNNEITSLKAMCDEIFGYNNFVDIISWFKKASPSNDAQFFSNDIEYIVVYAKNKNIWKPNRLPLTASQLKNYNNPDDDPRGAWNSATYTCNKSKQERPNLYYPIKNPNTGVIVFPKETAVWKYSQEQTDFFMQQNMLYWGTEGTAKYPRIKKFLSEHHGVVNRTLWHYDDVNHTQGASLELKSLGIDSFATPKPTRLIQKILHIATNPGDLILDSFAGSGTTGHAVLTHLPQNIGMRSFILIEINKEIAESVTSTRLRRVISAEAASSQDKNLQCCGFRYYRLGSPLFDEFGNVFSEIKFADLAKHVFFSETGTPLPDANDLTTPFIGEYNERGIFLLYNGILKDKNPKNGNVLTREVLAMLPKFDGEKVIYGTGCRLSDARLKAERITFKQIPYDLRG